MKKVVSIVLFLVVMIVFGGCNVIPKLDEEKIQSDVIAKAKLTNFECEITNFFVIKRQTNIENKEDIVYVSFSGENEHYSFVKNFKALYILYNDGWILEELEEYSDDTHENYVIPKHGVKDMGDWGTEEFVGSFKSEEIKTSCADPLILEASKPELDKNYGKHCFVYSMYYSYSGVSETVIIPVEYYFVETLDGDWTWQKVDVPKSRYQRELKLNSSIEGFWVSHYRNISTGEAPNKYSSFDVEISITDAQEDTAFMEYTRKYDGQLKESFKETVQLTYTIDPTSGKISSFEISPINSGYTGGMKHSHEDLYYFRDLNCKISVALIEAY